MKDRKFPIPSLSFGFINFKFKIPNFWKFRLPLPNGVYLGGGKLIIGGLSAVSLGFIAGMFLLINTGESQITFPQTGASYSNGSLIGSRYVDPEQPQVASQTLQIYAAADTRIDKIVLTNISLGKTGLTDAFAIQGLSTSDSIIIGELIIKNSQFPSIDIAASEIYSIKATPNVFVAGHTFDATVSNATNNITVGSARGATNYTAEDMTVDRILITQAAGTGDVIIGSVTLDNVKAWIGGINIDNVEIGTFTISDSSVGDDGNIDTADFVINSSVNVNNVTDGIVERPIFIR